MELTPTDLIVAPPGFADEKFGGSVIMLVNHVPHLGTVGLCINKPLFITIEDVLVDDSVTDSELLDCDLHWGGPIQEETLWMLHTDDWKIESTINIGHGWAITSHEDMFEHLTEYYRPSVYRMFMGYCSWERGQLMNEVTGTPPFRKKDSWLTVQSIDPLDVLNADPEEMWEEACEIACSQAVDRIFGCDVEA